MKGSGVRVPSPAPKTATVTSIVARNALDLLAEGGMLNC
jgi:hypothetical protein